MTNDTQHIKERPAQKFKRIFGNWRCTSDRRIYAIEQVDHDEKDRYIGTATSIDDAIDICNEHNKNHNSGE